MVGLGAPHSFVCALSITASQQRDRKIFAFPPRKFFEAEAIKNIARLFFLSQNGGENLQLTFSDSTGIFVLFSHMWNGKHKSTVQ